MINPHYVQISSMQEHVEFICNNLKEKKCNKKKKKKILKKLKKLHAELNEELLYTPMTKDEDIIENDLDNDDEGGYVDESNPESDLEDLEDFEDPDDWWKQ